MWKSLESFTEEQKCLFLRFVWGRSRLPLSAAEFERNFELKTMIREKPDEALPVSHPIYTMIE